VLLEMRDCSTLQRAECGGRVYPIMTHPSVEDPEDQKESDVIRMHGNISYVVLRDKHPNLVIVSLASLWKGLEMEIRHIKDALIRVVLARQYLSRANTVRVDRTTLHNQRRFLHNEL